MTAAQFGADLLDGLHDLEGHAADLIRGLRVTAARLAEERDVERRRADTAEAAALDAVNAVADGIRREEELTTERNCAREMASRATRDLVRIRHQLLAQKVVDKSRLTVIDGLNVELRRLAEHDRAASIRCEDLQRQLDTARQQVPETAPRRRRFTRRRNRRV